MNADERQCGLQNGSRFGCNFILMKFKEICLSVPEPLTGVHRRAPAVPFFSDWA
jgi:hypothetical protein